MKNPIKKVTLEIILALAISVFGITAYAETNDTTCIDINQSLTVGTSLSDILSSLTAPTCGMSLQDAAAGVIAAGGNRQDTLTAALVIDPDFSFIDPTAGLESTASGNEDGSSEGDHRGDNNGGDHRVEIASGDSSSGGGGTVSP